MYILDQKAVAEISFAYHCKFVTNIIGPTGAGKNTDLEFFCNRTNLPYFRLEMNEDIEPAKVFGKTDITGGDTVFSPGLFPISMTMPSIVVIDEVCRAPAFALVMFQRPLDRRQFVPYESKDVTVVEGHPDWCIFMTDNDNGLGDSIDQYVASNVLDAATLNRIQMYIHKDYMNRTDERKIIKALSPEMPSSDVINLAKFSYLMHAGFKKKDIRSAFSVRNLITVCTMYNEGMSLQHAVSYNFIARSGESEKSDIMESYRACFGDDVTASKESS